MHYGWRAVKLKFKLTIKKKKKTIIKNYKLNDQVNTRIVCFVNLCNWIRTDLAQRGLIKTKSQIFFVN